jgi:hypothetical protein
MSIGSSNYAAFCAGGELDGYDDLLIAVRVGDSGKPFFVVAATTPLLVSLFTYANSGPFIGANDGAIVNALIANADADAGVSTGYTVTVATDPTAEP